jgi:ABC-2 type transport system ATP-binding protein
VANQAVAALIAAEIEIADFSMGSPSLEEVFFALTRGHGEPGASRKGAA